MILSGSGIGGRNDTLSSACRGRSFAGRRSTPPASAARKLGARLERSTTSAPSTTPHPAWVPVTKLINFIALVLLGFRAGSAISKFCSYQATRLRCCHLYPQAGLSHMASGRRISYPSPLWGGWLAEG